MKKIDPLDGLDITVQPSRRKAVGWHLAGSYLHVLLLIVQGIVLVPLYIHYLGDRLYGFWLASGGVVAWIGVLDLGITAIVWQRCAAAYGRRELAAVGAYIRAGTVLVGCLAAAIVLLAAVVAPWVPVWLRVDEPWRGDIAWTFFLSALAFALGLGHELGRGFCVALQRNRLPVFMESAGTTLAIAVTVGGLIAGHGIWALPLGYLARSVVNTAVTGVYAWALARGCRADRFLDPYVLKDIWTIGPSVVTSRVLSGLTRQIEPLLITLFVRPELAVVFAVTQRALVALEPFVNQVIASTAGAFAHLIGEGNSQALLRAIGRTGTLIGVGSALVGIGFCVGNSGFVGLWVGPDHFGGHALTIAMALASAVMLDSRYLVSLLTCAGDQALTGYLVAAESALRLIVVLVLLPRLELLAFPIGLLVANLVVGMLAWRRSRTKLPEMGAALRELWVLPACGAALTLLAGVLAPVLPSSSWGLWLIGAAVAAGLICPWLLTLSTVRALVAEGWRRIARPADVPNIG